MSGRKTAVLRLVGIAYFPVIAVGTFVGFVLALILFVPSVLWQIITGREKDHEADGSLRFRLMMWFEDWRRFVLLGDGNMPWTP